MSNSKPYTHLSIEDRKTIETLLNDRNITLNTIADTLDYSPKCIRYEIKNHRKIRIRTNQHNKCGRQLHCSLQRLCTHCISGYCKGCKHDNCNQLCNQFIDYPDCPRTNRFPFVCSGCKKIESCKLPKYFYISEIAQREYESNITTWREGPKKNNVQIKEITEVLKQGVENNQSIDVIIHTNHLPISTATAYRYIENRYIKGICNIDLKRKVKYARRTKSTPKPIPMNYDFLEGRRFSDFTQLLAEHNCPINIWEMDTVLGKSGEEKCLLTLLHRPSNLQLIFLLKSHTMYEVNNVFSKIKEQLGDELFKEIFPVILTDNGSEFHDPLSLETSLVNGERLTHIYFCEPRRSDQKGKCEKNHGHIRDIIPKGTSMINLSTKEVRFVSRMVNNYPRPQFNYHSPYEVISKMVNKKVLELNEIVFVPSNQIVLKPITK